MIVEIYKLKTNNYSIKTLYVSEVNQEYVNWLNNPVINEFLEVKYTKWTIENCREYVKEFENTKSKYIFGIYENEKNTHIGNGSVSQVDRHTGTFSIALFIGNTKYWGGTAGLDAHLLLLKFGFDYLGLRKFFGGTYSNQLASRFTLRKIGAIEEARLRQRFKYKDELVDQIIYSLENKEWQRIKKRFNLEEFNEGDKQRN